MADAQVRIAVITQDQELRDDLARTINGNEMQLVSEIAVPFRQIGDEWLGHLRANEPQIILLDIEEDPALGIRLGQFLVENDPALRIVGLGPPLPAERLLAAMRAGFTEYLDRPLTIEEVVQGLRSTARRLMPRTDVQQHPGQLMSFFAAKGGSGATTIAANLAIHLHRLTGRKTLLVDLDLELGEIAVHLGVEARFNFVDMVRNYHRMDEGLLASYIERHESGVHLLSAPYFPQRPELVMGEQITDILTLLRQQYDYVIVDTSKSFSPPTMAAFEQSDLIFLVTTADLPSLRNIKRCMPLLERTIPDSSERVRLLVNRFQDDDLITTDDIQRTLGLPVYWTIANDYDAVMRSINSGRPIVTDVSSAYAHDVKALGAELAGLAPEAVARTEGPLTVLVQKFTRRRASAGNARVSANA
jgi:pilus assembly protein CpaE